MVCLGLEPGAADERRRWIHWAFEQNLPRPQKSMRWEFAIQWFSDCCRLQSNKICPKAKEKQNMKKILNPLSSMWPAISLFAEEGITYVFKKGCNSGGRAVASVTRDPRFECSHRHWKHVNHEKEAGNATPFENLCSNKLSSIGRARSRFYGEEIFIWHLAVEMEAAASRW